jgi:hypothetical protein
MSDDPILAAARRILEEGIDEIRKQIDGVSGDGLNWPPGGEGTNSMAVLTTHVMHSTRSWLCVALGAPLPPRDRPSEFRATADAPSLLAFFDEFAGDCRKLLADARDVDWGAMHSTHVRATPDVPPEEPGAYALLHALTHLREHVAHLQLTRQLWDSRA